MKSKSVIAIMLLFLLTAVFLNGGVSKLSQKKGIWQDQKEKHIQFKKYDEIEIDFDKMPLKAIRKMQLHKGNLFILDNKRNQVYVIDKRGNFQYTIGKPGQGPNEIQSGHDFYISRDDKIYILNSSPKRIEVFDILGKPLGSIRLSSDSFLFQPDSIILNNDGDFVVSNPFSKILVSIYDKNGNHKKDLLRRSDLPGYNDISPNLGITSALGYRKKSIIFFDQFKGEFTEIDAAGAITKTYSSFSLKMSERIKKIEDKRRISGKSGQNVSYSSFANWNYFCQAPDGTLYTLMMVRENGGYQHLHAFSSVGDFLFSLPLEFFKTIPISQFCCDDDCFVFANRDLKIIIAYRR